MSDLANKNSLKYSPLAERYASEVQVILAKYPSGQKRSAVMPLLYLAQSQGGYVTKQAMQDIAGILEITSTEVASIVGFYSLYYDEPAGKYRIQVCNDLPCALRGADQFLEKLCENLGIKVGETTSDGLVTVEAVMCLAGCDKAPMFQVQTGEGLEYHERQTVESALALVESWRNQPRSESHGEPHGEPNGETSASPAEGEQTSASEPMYSSPMYPSKEA